MWRSISRWTVAVLLAALITSGVAYNFTLAAKPSGGGSGGNNGGGTIYYSHWGQVYKMSPDGSGKTPLPAGVDGDPSRIVHGGNRWFLQSRTIEGEFYNADYARREFFAVRGDGNVSIQLTSDPNLQIFELEWAPGETASSALLSGLARRWVFDGTNWVIDPDSVGVYVASVRFDAYGDVIGLDEAPSFLVSLGVVAVESSMPNDLYPDTDWGIDFSPDLQSIVYDTYDGTQLRIMDVTSGTSRFLIGNASLYGPKWSPAGNLIVFGNGYGSIETIRPDGSERKEIIRWGVSQGYWYPKFSPTGSHVTYIRESWGDPWNADIYRATNIGGNKANLTSDISGYVYPMTWR
jgi:hypothetical protein